MRKHPFGHETLFHQSEMEEMSLIYDGALDQKNLCGRMQHPYTGACGLICVGEREKDSKD